MDIVNTSMQKIALHLSQFLPVLIETEKATDSKLTGFEFSSNNMKKFNPETLYILTITNEDDLEILKENSNFLILTHLIAEAKNYKEICSNVILISSNSNTFLLTEYIQGFFQAIDKFKSISTSLLLELEKENQLKHYLNLVSEYIEHPIAIFDNKHNLIAHSGSDEDITDIVWECLVMQKSDCNCSIVQNYLNQDLPDIILAMEYPVLYEKDEIPPRLIVGLDGSQTNSYVLEVLENGKHFKNSDQAVVYFTSSFFQYFMISQYHNLRQDTPRSLVEEVILGKESDQYRLFTRAKELNFLMQPENYLLLIYTDGIVGYQEMLTTVHELRESTRRPVILAGTEILVFLHGKEQLSKNRSILYRYIKEKRCYKCALSTEFTSIIFLKKAYEQCIATRKLSSILDVNGIWFDYDAYREQHFFYTHLSDNDIDFFCIPVAKDIVQYDKINKTKYAYTLLLYLKNFKNGTTVANTLHTHRNTMFYRLERIATMFALDYENPIQMNNLLLSFNILATRNPDIFS